MTRFDDLIQEHCPGGVNFVPLGALIDYEQPGKYLVESTAYDDSYSTPVLTAGQTFVLGCTDETTGIYPGSTSDPVIIFDDFTTAFKWVDFPFKAKSSAMKVLTSKNGAPADLRYVYYAMQTITYRPQDHARQWIGTYSGFRIPVPPREIQLEIVSILDQFTQLEAQLEAELEAELEARRSQYEHYRDLLIVQSEEASDTRLDAIAEFRRGTAFTAKQARGGEYPVVANGPVPIGFHDEFNRDGEYLVVARSGANAGTVSFWSGKAFLTDAFSVHADTSQMRSRYMFHLLKAVQAKLHSMREGSGVPHVRVVEIAACTVHVPSLETQDEIVHVLDKFDVLVNDLSTGLPAELAARRKQYEYYRDKLLTFEEAAA